MVSSSRCNAAEQESAHRRASQVEPGEPTADTQQASDGLPAALVGLLRNPALGSQVNASVRASASLSLQRTVGNRAVQRILQPTSGGTAQASDEDLGQRIAARQGGGSRLSPATASLLEGGLGADLGHVRVHTDHEADQLARSVQANAFTTGSDIFFRSGLYNPDSMDGLRLLAHESTHTLQQAAGPVATTDAPGGVAISSPEDSFEQAASLAADRVVSSAVAVAGPSGPADAGASTRTGPTPVQRDGEEGGAHEEEPLWKQIAGPALEVAGAVPYIGAPAHAISAMLGISGGLESGAEGDTGGLIKGALEGISGIGGLAAHMGGFSLLGGAGEAAAGSMEAGALLTGATELGAIGAMGAGSAVIGAGLGGIGLGILADKGVNALGQAITGDDKGDYSISNGIAKSLTAADQGLTSLWADPSKPEYTQTIGWQLANLFD